MEWIARGSSSRCKRIMESKLMKDHWSEMFARKFYIQLKADQKEKAATKQRLKIALIIGGIIICLMLIMTS